MLTFDQQLCNHWTKRSERERERQPMREAHGKQVNDKDKEGDMKSRLQQ